MSGLGNKEIFSKNLNYYIQLNGLDRKRVCEDLGFAYTTFTDWCNGKIYPRIDKIELLANYFGIMKSDLIEQRSNNPVELSDEAKMIGAAYDKAAPKDKQTVKYILSDYMDDASDLPPLQIAARNGAKLELTDDLLDLDLSGEDSKIP